MDEGDGTGPPRGKDEEATSQERQLRSGLRLRRTGPQAMPEAADGIGRSGKPTSARIYERRERR